MPRMADDREMDRMRFPAPDAKRWPRGALTKSSHLPVDPATNAARDPAVFENDRSIFGRFPGRTRAPGDDARGADYTTTGRTPSNALSRSVALARHARRCRE